MSDFESSEDEVLRGGPKLPPLRPRSPLWAVLAGLIAGGVSGLGATGLLAVLTSSSWATLNDLTSWTTGTLVVSNFFVIPFGMGFVASFFWRDLEGPWWNPAFYIFSLTFLSLVGAAFLLREGTICLFMVSPILLLLIGFGVSVGRKFWKKTPFLSASLLPLGVALLIFDGSWPHHYATTAQSQFFSKAAPASLWRYAASYPPNPRPADWWLWQIGVPMPLHSHGETEVGGRRDTQLSHDVEVGMRVVEAVPNRKLEFVIDRQPQHPEAMNHLILKRGRIEMWPENGGTRVRTTSWYELKVFPANYFDLWTKSIIRQTHRRVFEWMDEQARADEQKAK